MTDDADGRFDCLEADDRDSGQALRGLFILAGLLVFLGVQIGLLGVIMR
jgi:hypothetical protein